VQKRKYFGAFFAAQMPEGVSGRAFLEFFQTDRDRTVKRNCGVESSGGGVVTGTSSGIASRETHAERSSELH
jgi:hypothetical protein